MIGAGQGASLARMLCEAGQKVALIEKEAIGGSCINRGCTPTKAHLAAAKRAQDARTAEALGVYTSEVRVDLPKIVERSRRIVHEFRHEVQDKLEKLESLDLIFGTARFVDGQSVEIQTRSSQMRLVTAARIVIATGTRAEIPHLRGLNDIEWLDHRSMLQLETIPEKLLILGGGYIACEFAQMFCRFGAEVCIAQSGSQLLQKEDEDVAAGVADILRDENIEICLECEADSVEKTAEGLKCHFKNGRQIEASHLLLAVGQVPNTDALDIEKTALRLDDKGHIQTDEFLQAAPGVWALGDVKGGPAFTHIAYDDARIVGDIFIREQKRSIKERPVPYCVFTDPQLGRVGLTESAARQQNIPIRVAHYPCSEMARGIESGEARGFYKVIVHAETEQMLGGAFLCRDGGEIVAALQLAMQGQLPYTALRDGIFAHPTWVESFNNLFLAMERCERGERNPGCMK